MDENAMPLTRIWCIYEVLRTGAPRMQGRDQASYSPLKKMEYGVYYGDRILIYPKPYSIYLMGTIILLVVSGEWGNTISKTYIPSFPTKPQKVM